MVKNKCCSIYMNDMFYTSAPLSNRLSVAQDAHAERELDAGQNLNFDAGAERGILSHAERQASGKKNFI